jgi:4-amino-4-deoxy-L-arabinose transferase-like glycosyltransferase
LARLAPEVRTPASLTAPDVLSSHLRDQSNKPPEGFHDSEIQEAKYRLLILAALSALVLLACLPGHGLAGYDDAVYAHEGKEMVRTGDWWNVRFNGNLNFEYPPLFLWLEATSFKLFGVHDAAAKVPTTLLGFATIVLTYFLTLALTGRHWLSQLAMIVLASTQFFLKNATHAMTDVPFTFFFTLAIFFYVKGLKSERYFALLGLPLGLALLTRSVIGLLALGIIAVHLMLMKRFRQLISPWLISGVLFAITLPSIWYLSQYRMHGAAAIAAHFRFVRSKISAGSESSRWSTVLNYPLALLKYYWPWLPFMIVGLLIEGRAMARRKDGAASLLIVWVLLVLVPFGLVQTRYPRYIMPVFPAFSILAAFALDRLIPPARRRIFFRSVCLLGGAAAGLILSFPSKARATDIETLVPIAELNSSPRQRVVVYSYEDGRSDYLNQFLWYSSRFAELAPDVRTLSSEIVQSQGATVIIDKGSYGKLLLQMSHETLRRVRVVGESDHFLCLRISGP